MGSIDFICKNMEKLKLLFTFTKIQLFIFKNILQSNNIGEMLLAYGICKKYSRKKTKLPKYLEDISFNLDFIVHLN